MASRFTPGQRAKQKTFRLRVGFIQGEDDMENVNEAEHTANAVAEKPADDSAMSATPLTEKVKEQATQVVKVTREKAGDFLGEAQNQLTSRLTDEKTAFSNSLDQVAEVVFKTGQDLREQDQAMLAQYVDSAAEMVTNVSGYVRKTDWQDFSKDVESYARQRPALFIGGVFVLGLLAGRFLKSSGQNIASSSANAGYDPLLPVRTSTSNGAVQSYATGG